MASEVIAGLVDQGGSDLGLAGAAKSRLDQEGAKGLGPIESHKLKERIAAAIVASIGERKLNRKEAAAAIGVGQDKISLIFRSKLRGFSAERLLKFLINLGHDVEIRASKSTGDGPGRVRFRTLPSARPDDPGTQ